MDSTCGTKRFKQTLKTHLWDILADLLDLPNVEGIENLLDDWTVSKPANIFLCETLSYLTDERMLKLLNPFFFFSFCHKHNCICSLETKINHLRRQINKLMLSGFCLLFISDFLSYFFLNILESLFGKLIYA